MTLSCTRDLRYVLSIISALAVIVHILLYANQAPSNDVLPHHLLVKGNHPIDRLVRDAQQTNRARQVTVDARLTAIAEVAQAYRARRGRHPPPGFDAWYTLAVRSNASIDEYFFDQIYEDLEPFRGEIPQKLRSFAERWPYVLSLRNNTAHKRTKDTSNIWLDIFQSSIDEMPFLPDVDLAISPSDEPHVLVAFADLTKYMEEADYQKQLHIAVPVAEIRDEMVRYPDIVSKIPSEPSRREEGLTNITASTYWDCIVRACRPDDPVFSDLDPYLSLYTPPRHSSNHTAGTLQGYVSNLTTSKNPCHNANLRTLHGHIIGPGHDFVFTKLKPLISATKLQGISNDIVFPNPVHMLTWGLYQLQDSYAPWSKKRNMAVWRGGTGGRHTASTWWGFHRLRFLQLMNSTVVTFAEESFNQLKATVYDGLPWHGTPGFDWSMHNFPFPSQSLYNLSAQVYGKLGQWTASTVDGALTEFSCAPFYQFSSLKGCSYLESSYRLSKKMDPKEIDKYKYLPDIDGYTSSGRYRSFLHSFSVPIKASLFVEWADVRLRPWLHFVPMSNEFQEWFGIMEYFLGYKATGADEVSVPDHDLVGQWIGQQGAEWSRKVLRVEDMHLYIYRLILEYARICADDRIYLGWVGDL